MQKKTSVRSRLFIIFVMLRTIFSIVVLTDVFRGISSDWHKIERDVIEESKDSEAQELTKSSISMLMQEEKRDARVMFLQLLILPTVLVYCLGQIAGWIVKGYWAEKVAD